MPPAAFRIVVLISGSGTTLRNLIEHRQQGKLGVEIAHVISSSPRAGGLQFAHSAQIATSVIRPVAGEAPQAFRDAVFDVCRARGADLVVMAGLLKHLPIAPDFENRVVNIHPALIPAFCGPGLYGLHVHRAVIEFGCKVTGCTVHFADDQYDHGPIIAQRCVPVLPSDQPETLQARVFAEECRLYPRVIQAIADGEVHVHGRIVLWPAAESHQD